MQRLVVCLVLVAAACSTGEGSERREGATTIVVQVAGEAEEVAVYRAAARAFEQENARVDVNLVGVADKDDHLARLATSFAVGSPPDVFLVNYREYAQFVTRGVIEPFGRHLDGAGIDPDDYFDPPLEAFTYDGELQCMPQNISSLVVYYNPSVFDEAGVEHPDGSWDWNGFRAAAHRLTGGDVHGAGIDPSIIRVAPFVWANGGEIVDDPVAPSRFTLEEPSARGAFEFVVSLVRDDGVVPSEEDVAAQDLETRFATGKLAMYLSSRKHTPVFREVAGLDFDVAALPAAPGGGRAGILHSDAYCIARGGDLDAAVAFIGFMTGEGGATITALGGRTVPSLRSVAESGAFLDPTRPPASSDVFLDTIPVIRRTPVLPTWPEIEDVTEEILTRAFYERGYTIDDALQDLDRRTGPLFAEGAP